MPQPGERPFTGYIYLDIPFSTVRQQSPEFGLFLPLDPYVPIEAFAKSIRVLNVDRRDHIDRSRVYRFPNTSLLRFTPDTCHPGEYFLEIYPTKFTVLFNDPGIGRSIVRDWNSI